MKLFLASLASETLDLIRPMLPDAPNKLKVAFITTAADTYDTKPWVDSDRAKLVGMGFDVTNYDIKGKTCDQVIQDLKSYNVVFVCGGNTFYLLDHVKKSGFDIAIHKLLDQGIVYVGSSAGSIIMGPDVEYFKSFDAPVPALTDFRGLNIFKDLIIPHYGREKYAERHSSLINDLQSKALPYKIQPLRDNQAVMIDGNKIEIVSCPQGQTLRVAQ